MPVTNCSMRANSSGLGGWPLNRPVMTPPGMGMLTLSPPSSAPGGGPAGPFTCIPISRELGQGPDVGAVARNDMYGSVPAPQQLVVSSF